MKELEKFLKVLSDGMRTLAQGVEGLAQRVDELSTAQSKPPKPTPRKTPRTATPKKAPKTAAKQGTATDSILAVIRRSKKGVNMSTLKEKTGFEDKKIHNILYKLKKKGLIKSGGKGIYIKA